MAWRRVGLKELMRSGSRRIGRRLTPLLRLRTGVAWEEIHDGWLGSKWVAPLLVKPISSILILHS